MAEPANLRCIYFHLLDGGERTAASNMPGSAPWGAVLPYFGHTLETSWCVLGVIGSLMLYGVLQVEVVVLGMS
jgi:hypothetical protein